MKITDKCIFKGQMFLMDRFFDGAFLTFGLEVIAFAEQDQEDRLDPLIYVFPRMTKVSSTDHDKGDLNCLFFISAPSTNSAPVEKLRNMTPCAYCHLILLTRKSTFFFGFGEDNIHKNHDQIILIILFRFILLAVLSTLVILYRLIIIISPKMRAYLLYIRFRLIRREVINTIVKKSYVGDWFLFYMLGQNVDSMIFKEVMHELARKLGHLGKDFSDT